MKKISLATIIAALSISLMACTNSGGVSNSNNDVSTMNDSTISKGVDSRINDKITIEQAKEIALKHAGLSADQVSFVRTELDNDNNIQKYEVEFYYNSTEYDYEINAVNGEILSYDKDIENYNLPGTAGDNGTGSNVSNAGGAIDNSSNVGNTSNTNKISSEKAKEIALKHAGLSADQVLFEKTELDYDDDNGTQEYEVEFRYNNIEYSYEIDADTGAIICYEKD